MKGNHPTERVVCGARTRTGGECGHAAMSNGRCRYHGGKSLSGAQHGRYKSGQFTREALEEKRQFSELLRASRDLIKKL